MWYIVVSEDLLVLSVLVSEHAASSVETNFFLVESPAVLGLQLIVGHLGSDVLGQLVIAVSKSALLAVAANSTLNPVLAHLSLVLRLLVLALEEATVEVLFIHPTEAWLGIEPILLEGSLGSKVS